MDLEMARLQAERQSKGKLATVRKADKVVTHGNASTDSTTAKKTVDYNALITVVPGKNLMYSTFEAQVFDHVKANNPHTKLPALREIIWKEWQKSPHNPKKVEGKAEGKK